jgi:hypothetical protein
MSSIVNRLTEGVVNRDMRAESHALLSKWKKTGLLEGIETERKQNTMARLLENQAKELLREQTTMGTGGSVEGFAAVAFPIVRRVFAGLIANDLVSVQPMSLPSGLIFFLDFVYSGNIGADGTMADRFGNTADKSIYGTDRVGSQITGGVNIVGSLGENLSGPRDMVGYAYGSPETVLFLTSSAVTIGTNVAVASLTQAQKKQIKFDPDLLAETAANVLELKVAESSFTNPDLDNLSAFNISGSSLLDIDTGSGLDDDNCKLIRRLTSTDGTDISFFFTSEAAGLLGFAITAGPGLNLTIDHPVKDSASASGTAAAGAIDTYTMLLEANANIPEIDIKVDSIAVTAQTKKLKAKWTPELGQDLNAYHNLDAEVELTSILSEQIALEIDREILADLVNGATAATRYWSRAPGLFVDSSGAELGATSAAPDFTGTVSEWYETLVETINDVSAQIHRKTLRGGANFVVCGPEVANILEFTAGFRASVTHDDEKGSIGALRVGSLSKKFDVIVDPYFLRNVILIGRRGASFLESGYVYAPYVPLQTTPTIFGPEDFVPRKGVMTRYAKKMVRPDMYGLVVVRGLLGESGS